MFGIISNTTGMSQQKSVVPVQAGFHFAQILNSPPQCNNDIR
jgi:hypothetical protein